MHLLDQRMLGAAILILLGILVGVKRAATGSIFDRPAGNFLVQLVNIFNLFFLLVVNPLAAILLIARRLPDLDPSRVTIHDSSILIGFELAGLAIFAFGYILMAWALITLGRNYQPGGSAPRSDDNLVSRGPYRLARHPMYGAALGISLGLACMVLSWAFFVVFCIYLVLVSLLIPYEEIRLRTAYGDQYVAYQQRTKRLIPFVC